MVRGKNLEVSQVCCFESGVVWVSNLIEKAGWTLRGGIVRGLDGLRGRRGGNAVEVYPRR